MALQMKINAVKLEKNLVRTDEESKNAAEKVGYELGDEYE